MKTASMKIKFPVGDDITPENVRAYILDSVAGIGTVKPHLTIEISNKIEDVMYQSFDFEVSDIEIK